MQAMIWVFFGGGLGSLCRYGIAVGLETTKSNFPYPTFWANFISCFILGILTAYVLKSDVNPHLKLFFMTGFCGGFSTFSTFTAEVFSLIQTGNLLTASAYILASLIICLGALLAGYRSGFILF